MELATLPFFGLTLSSNYFIGKKNLPSPPNSNISKDKIVVTLKKIILKASRSALVWIVLLSLWRS